MDQQTTYIIISSLMGVIYSVTGYLKNYGQELDYVKLISNAIGGLVIGIAFAMSGTDVTEQSVLVMLGAYAGWLAIVENIIKAAIRRLRGEPKLI